MVPSSAVGSCSIVERDSVTELAASHRVRQRVFIDEQGVPKDEVFDDLDDGAVHVVAHCGDATVGCARCVDEGAGTWRIG